jgi:hypothetical protein
MVADVTWCAAVVATTASLLAVLGGLISYVFVTVVMKEEYRWWGPWLAQRVVQCAASLVPRAKRDLRLNEWLAELDQLQHTGVPGVIWSLRLMRAGAEIRLVSMKPRKGWFDMAFGGLTLGLGAVDTVLVTGTNIVKWRWGVFDALTMTLWPVCIVLWRRQWKRWRAARPTDM